jgi:hypothetical protein
MWMKFGILVENGSAENLTPVEMYCSTSTRQIIIRTRIRVSLIDFQLMRIN